MAVAWARLSLAVAVALAGCEKRLDLRDRPECPSVTRFDAGATGAVLFPERDFVCEPDARPPCTTSCGAHRAATRTAIPTEDLDGATFLYVIDNLSLPEPADGRAAGFNLDGLDTRGPVAATCEGASEDYVSIAGDRVGVDNALGGVLRLVDELLDGSSCGFSTDCLTDRLQRQVNEGSYLVLVEVSGVDDLHYDPSIRVQLVRAATPGTVPCSTDGDCTASGERCIADECRPVPALRGDRLEAGQDFVALEPFGHSVPGDIFGGRVRAFPMRLTVPIDMNGSSVRLWIENAEVRFDIADSGLSGGEIGGVVAWADLAGELASVGPPLGCLCWWYGCCDRARDYLAEWRDFLQPAADIRPSAIDPEVCDLLSVGVTFGGTTARRR